MIVSSKSYIRILSSYEHVSLARSVVHFLTTDGKTKKSLAFMVHHNLPPFTKELFLFWSRQTFEIDEHREIDRFCYIQELAAVLGRLNSFVCSIPKFIV
jgi:hypothetical protein